MNMLKYMVVAITRYIMKIFQRTLFLGVIQVNHLRLELILAQKHLYTHCTMIPRMAIGD